MITTARTANVTFGYGAPQRIPTVLSAPLGDEAGIQREGHRISIENEGNEFGIYLTVDNPQGGYDIVACCTIRRSDLLKLVMAPPLSPCP